MKQRIFFVLIILLANGSVFAQTNSRKVVIVTLDGYRWQELFRGADERIVNNRRWVTDSKVAEEFSGKDQFEKRAKLMPFFWSTIAKQGQLYGNRKLGNKVNCANFQLISYPGYNEMLTGSADMHVRSNKLVNNPNATVLEYLNEQDEHQGKVAAFSTWDAFPFILRENESNIHVNAATEISSGNISEHERWLNENESVVFNPHNGARYDEYTFAYAMEYMKRKRPDVMLISFNETDEHGHGGRYAKYLHSAHKADSLVGTLWNWIQSQPDYKDQTTLIITTDHGRGKGKNNWRKHLLFVPGSRHTWFAVIGPQTPALGEMATRQKYFQKQTAKTIAAFLGYDYTPQRKTGEVIHSMIKSNEKLFVAEDAEAKLK